MNAPLPADPPARTTAKATLLSEPSGSHDTVRLVVDSPGAPSDWHAGARFVLVPILPEDAS